MIPFKNIVLLFVLSATVILITGCPGSLESGCLNPIATNYNPNAAYNEPCLCEYNGINQHCNLASPSVLSIQPIMQQTEVWCWLAVGEMVFKYYGVPNVNPGGDYQCGIVGATGYALNGACDACNLNCGNCVRPAGSASMMTFMLTNYPRIACRSLFNTNQTLRNSYVANYLNANFLIQQLDARKPVIAGINPGTQFVLPGNSQHVCLIVGYYFDGLGNLILRVNDPFPYWYTGYDPYVANGAINNGDLSYQISFNNLVGGLRWNTSWFDIGW